MTLADCPAAPGPVVCDVNSTLTRTLVGVKKGIPVVHVEAGVRSYERGERGQQLTTATS